MAAWTPEPICALCGCNVNGGLERHHKVFRSRGGGDEDANLVLICRVCHGAVHGRAVEHRGHSCRTCPVLKRDGCHFGERVLGRAVVTPKPWKDRSDD